MRSHTLSGVSSSSEEKSQRTAFLPTVGSFVRSHSIVSLPSLPTFGRETLPKRFPRRCRAAPRQPFIPASSARKSCSASLISATFRWPPAPSSSKPRMSCCWRIWRKFANGRASALTARFPTVFTIPSTFPVVSVTSNGSRPAIFVLSETYSPVERLPLRQCSSSESPFTSRRTTSGCRRCGAGGSTVSPSSAPLCPAWSSAIRASTSSSVISSTGFGAGVFSSAPLPPVPWSSAMRASISSSVISSRFFLSAMSSSVV